MRCFEERELGRSKGGRFGRMLMPWWKQFWTEGVSMGEAEMWVLSKGSGEKSAF